MNKLTPKQTAFAQKYIELGNASEAYRQVYQCERMKTETVHKLASRLLNHPAVNEHIHLLKAEHKARHMITVDDLLTELEQARVAALKASTPQSSAAVSATMAKAKLLGLDKQLVEISGKDGQNLIPTGLGYFYGEMFESRGSADASAVRLPQQSGLGD